MMTSSNCYSSLYPFPIDLNEDDPHQQHQLFGLNPQPSSSSSSSSLINCPNLFFSPAVQHQAGYQSNENNQHFQPQEEAKVYVLQGDEPLESDSVLKLSIWKKGEEEEERNESHQIENSSAKWMSSKMRMMRKMMSSDHADNSSLPKSEDQKQQLSSSPDNSCSNSSYNNNNSSNTIRVCADCNTTKTPLWRSGPRGPKSLCNACGIRQRKARRAMAAAAAEAANGSIVATEATPMKSKVRQKAKRSNNNGFAPQLKNKECKLSSQSHHQGRKKLCFEDLTIILSKNSAFHRVFPQDEKEAAILLMALSYGLVHG